VLYAGTSRRSEQLRALTDDLRSERTTRRSRIDEEGGDVTRLEAARELVSRERSARVVDDDSS
jgi:hypothetical protein